MAVDLTFCIIILTNFDVLMTISMSMSIYRCLHRIRQLTWKTKTVEYPRILLLLYHANWLIFFSMVFLRANDFFFFLHIWRREILMNFEYMREQREDFQLFQLVNHQLSQIHKMLLSNITIIGEHFSLFLSLWIFKFIELWFS